MKKFGAIFLILCVLGFGIFQFLKPPKPKVAFLVMATGKYSRFAKKLIQSGKKHALKRSKVDYIIFTDQRLPYSPNVRVVYQKKLGWPYDTLKRFHAYRGAKDILKRYDYLLACDADMLFVSDMNEEVLSDLIGTQHPGFVGQRGTYETNFHSAAFIGNDEGSIYYAGGFYGGSQKCFFHLLDQVIYQIDEDLAHDYIAIWHDESHLNRYFATYEPTKILSPSFCYPQSWDLPYSKVLLALDKNHKKMRE